MKNKKIRQNPVQNIYWDVDDVVLNTSETLVKIINEKYLIPNGIDAKTIYDIRDWNLKSIYKYLTPEQLNEIFASNEFWDNVSIKMGFIQIIKSGVLSNYFNYFLTIGTEENLSRKEQFLKDQLGDDYEQFFFIGIPDGKNKSEWDMYDSIQIDDNFENLVDTNAKIKILLKNGLDTCYNNGFNYYIDHPDNLYYVHSLKDVYEILEFNTKNKL